MFKVKHDQFYAYDHVLETQADFVQQVMDKHNLYVTRIEDPCAGDGRISQYVNVDKMYDIDPGSTSVTKRDFLKHTQPFTPGLLLIMNVPYGKQSKKAIDFFNHGASMAEYMAIIVPYSWNKASFAKRELLNPYWHKVASKKLPPNSFYTRDGTTKDVTSCIQFYVRRNTKRRPIKRQLKSEFFIARQNTEKHLTSHPEIAVCRVGDVGQIVTKDFGSLTQSNWWYIYPTAGNKTRVLQALKSVDWSRHAKALGVSSINKTALINQCNRAIIK